MTSIPKRGLLQGQWYSDLNSLPDRSRSVQQSFRTPAARVEIDIDRLHERPESYHIYAAKACPFAHRVLMMLAHLPQAAIGVTYCDPWLGHPQGWTFMPGSAPPAGDRFLWEVYTASDPFCSGRVTVLVLWDCEASAIASAESLDIIRALAAAHGPHMCPADEVFSALCDRIHETLNVGVYRIGFAASQNEYDIAIEALNAVMDEVSALVAKGFAFGGGPTLADFLIFATGVRFDAAYHGAFQILHRQRRDNVELLRHLETVAALPGIAETLAIEDYRIHYFDDAGFSIRHPMVNGRYIVPRIRAPI